MKSMFEEMGGTYMQVGDFLLPNLYVESREEYHPIGKYGRMRKRYLKEHRPILFSNILLFGKLDQHLAEIDRACIERMDLLTRQMADREGSTEALKAVDQFEWVTRMCRWKGRRTPLRQWINCWHEMNFLSFPALNPAVWGDRLTKPGNNLVGCFVGCWQKGRSSARGNASKS